MSRYGRSWNLFQVIVYAKTPLKYRLCNKSTTPCVPTPTCPSSASCLSVSWIVFPPYSSNVDSISPGAFPKILNKLLNGCCPKCSWKLNLTEQTTNIGDLVLNGSTFDIAFPYFRENDKTRHHSGMWFVPLVKNPSVDFITKKPSTSGIPRKLINAVWNAWPVLIVALLLSLGAGIFIWVLEFRSNHEEFPRSFSKGSWEGFWWAFVSMTTVGYGDRSPRTILGRAFAVCWILIGICICSIFTATLTTSLTAISLEDKRTLNRAKVGVLRNSLEASIGIQNQAKLVSYGSLAEVWNALEQDYVDGILLDSFYSATQRQHEYIEENELKIVKSVICDGWSYGLLAKSKTFADCMDNYFYENHAHVIYQEIADAIESNEGDEHEAQKRSASLLDINGGLFYPTLFVCLPIVVLMICAGLIWEYCFILRRQIKDISKIPRNDRTLDKMEKEMVSDVHRLFASWKAELAEMGRAGQMELIKREEKA